VKSLADEIKQLAETLSHIEEGDSVSPMHGTLADLVNIVRGRDHTYKGTQGWGSKFGLINQHNEGGNVIIVFADNGLGQIWIKVPQKNTDQAKTGAKTKKPDLSTLVPLDGVEVKYTDDEQDINWHGSAQNFIPLFNKGKFPPPSVTVPNDGQQSFYQGLSWDKAGTVQNFNAEADPKDPKFTYKDLGVGDPLDDQPANDDVYESLAEQIKALTNTLAKLEKNKD
jgi:hypothetical protein